MEQSTAKNKNTSCILKGLYDISLCAALKTIDNYREFSKQKFVKEKLMQKDFVLLYLHEISHLLNKCRKITPTIKDNVLTLLNDLRFNNYFDDKEDKSTIYKLINDAIVLVNTKDVLPDEVAYSLRGEELVIANAFYIIHYYLMDDEVYQSKGIPFLKENEYYVDSIYFLLETEPELLQEPLFLKRTYMLLNPEIYYSEEREAKYIKKLQKNLAKEIRRGR